MPRPAFGIPGNILIKTRHGRCSQKLCHKLRFQMLSRQTTLAAPAETTGIGLHTAVPVTIRLLPAPPDTGYVFRRVDLGGFEIPATVEFVAHCSYATTLMRTGVMLSTVEHLLSALRGCGVDNAYIEVDNLEVPIMDGSAEAFAEMIESAGLAEQPTARRALLVRETVSVDMGTRRASLIRGGSLDNAIVLTKEGMLNETGLRFPDEFVRHKILDIIGDLALLGMPILGRVKAERSGHLLHATLTSSLLKNRAAWEIVDLPASVDAHASALR